ncbi:hypothetical protein TNCV_2004341 [Trichonephila clavipes]|nr:hypothetical protein TNCV_2004341 [Trichonephila clavipes]
MNNVPLLEVGKATKRTVRGIIRSCGRVGHRTADTDEQGIVRRVQEILCSILYEWDTNRRKVILTPSFHPRERHLSSDNAKLLEELIFAESAEAKQALKGSFTCRMSWTYKANT